LQYLDDEDHTEDGVQRVLIADFYKRPHSVYSPERCEEGWERGEETRKEGGGGQRRRGGPLLQ
jgi:hypothetical protein